LFSIHWEYYIHLVWKYPQSLVYYTLLDTISQAPIRKIHMARTTLTKHVARRQEQTFADWCVEVRDLAGERWPDFSDQAPTLYAVWGGGATPQQALYMVGLILPPKAAA
jgi:hypothetical protein